MNDFNITAQYIFKRAELLIGKCTFLLLPGNLIAVGKLYPRIGHIANDNEAEK